MNPFPVSLPWHTSSYSNGGTNCVEVARTAERTYVRDTKNRPSATLAFGPSAWSAFTSSSRTP